MALGRTFIGITTLVGAGALVAAACSSTPSDGRFPDSGSNVNGDATVPRPDTGMSFGDAEVPDADASKECAAVQVTAGKVPVDIIFVIDNSGSMSSEMAQVKANVNTFASKIGSSGLDYRVVFLVAKGTGSLQICVPQPLGGANCSDNPPTFYHPSMGTSGVQSSDSLSLILSSYDTSWKNYIRFDAFKVFIEVTDDDARAPYVTSDTFEKQLFAKTPTGMFGDATKRRYTFNSICGWKEGTANQSTSYCSGAVNPGLEYQRLSYTTGGLIDSVCKTDYSGVLDNFANNIRERLACEYQVPTPEAGTADPNKVVVVYTAGGSPTGTPLGRVTDISKCELYPQSWYFDDNTSPKRIIFCADTCKTVQADNKAQVDLRLGCDADPPR